MTVRYETGNGVAVLTLDDEANRNALNAASINAIGDAMTRAIEDPDARIILLTHAGPVFCAGADLKGMGQETPRHGLPDVLALMQDSPKPVVAVLRGPAMGGGVGLAAAADLSIATTDVTFGFTEVRLGLAPAIISVVCVPKLSRADAAELFLTGKKITAARAVEVGLINDAVPSADLNARVAELVTELVAGSPGGLTASKQLIRDVPTLPRAQAFAQTAELSARLFAGPEATEGIAAFRGKRAAAWVPEAPFELA